MAWGHTTAQMNSAVRKTNERVLERIMVATLIFKREFCYFKKNKILVITSARVRFGFQCQRKNIKEVERA
jgi:hypothetical protein